MIDQILNYLNKYFPVSVESASMSIVADGVEYSFNETYLVGQYVNIHGSVLNDGTYKITAVAPGKLTLDATLQVETNDIEIYGLAIPTALLSVISDIEAYAAKAPAYNIKIEKQGKRSVEFANGSAWEGAFSNRLAPYRSMFDDRSAHCRKYNIDTKGW